MKRTNEKLALLAERMHLRQVHDRVERSRRAVELAHACALSTPSGGEHLCEGDSAAVDGTAGLGDGAAINWAAAHCAAVDGAALLGDSAAINRATLLGDGAAVNGTARLENDEFHFVGWWLVEVGRPKRYVSTCTYLNGIEDDLT